MLSPALVLPSVALVLLLGPPADESRRPPVQSPQTSVISPTQPAPGEPAIAPADVGGERAVTEPAPIDPGPIAEPEPEPTPTEPAPDSELPSWQSEPIPDPEDLPGGTTNPQVDEWGMPLPPPEKPKKRGPPKGGGFYAGAGALLGIMITKQWIMALTCEEDVFCGWRGNIDRGLGLGVMGLAAGGGWFQGRREAYWAHDAGKPAKPLTGRRAAGWTMFAVGLGGLLADAILYNVCYTGAVGPYTKLAGFSYTCSPVASVVIVDLSTAIGAVGMGMGLSAESQRKFRKKYDRAAGPDRVTWSVAPWGGRGQAGLSLSGRF